MDESDRLDSWKQIAAYLGKSERTVRRWQETEGLPVHRHLHQQRGSVWAYRSELDSWVESRRLGPEPLTAEAPAHVPSARLTRPVVMLLGVTCAGLLTFTAAMLSRSRQQSPLTFREPVQMSSLPGVVHGPSFSPDGGRIVFHWWS